MSADRWQLVVLAGLAAVLFFAGLGLYDLWPPDEPRFGQVAREMMQSGDYLVPRINGEPYHEKPPLLFWAIAAVSQPFGDVTETSARVPSALAAFLVILLTWLLGRSLFDARTGFWAGVMLATTSLFWWEGRSVRTDMLLTAWMALSLYAFWQWDQQRQRGWLAAFWIAVALGVYVKGPPALVFPLLLVWAYYWRRPEDRRQMHWVLGTIAVIAAAALWLVPARIAAADAAGAAHEVMAGNLFRQTIGRLFGVSKAQWPWYYVVNLPVKLLPWTLFLPWTILWTWRRRHAGPGMRLLLCWTVPALVFFSLSVGKRSVYLLPLYPAFAILFSASIADLMEAPDRRTWRRWTGGVFAALLALVGAAPFALLATPYAEALTEGLVLFGVFCLFVAAETLYRALKGEARVLHMLVASRFAGIALLMVAIALPVLDQYKSARTITAPVRAASRAGADFRLYSVGFSREEYIFYSEHFHTPVLVDALDVDLPAGTTARQAVRSQRRLRTALVDAAREAAPEDIANITHAEWDRLRQRVSQAVEEVEVTDRLAAALEDALEAEATVFAEAFEESDPAFAYVQIEDWRWLAAIEPRLRHHPVLLHEMVGSREVLLVGNAAGAALAAQRGLDLAPSDADALAPTALGIVPLHRRRGQEVP